MTIGNVINKETYTAVAQATPSAVPAYNGFRLFSQHNWYQSDTQLGSMARSCRLSLEYLDTNGPKYACCGADCQPVPSPRIDYGLIVAYVK